VARDRQMIHLRCAEQPPPIRTNIVRGLGNMPWHSREFVVKDCDGRLLAFGANL
jgi:hypothetical protein